MASSSSLGYAVFSNSNKSLNSNSNSNQSLIDTKTAMKKPTKSQKIIDIINNTKQLESIDEEDNNTPTDLLPPPQISNVKKVIRENDSVIIDPDNSASFKQQTSSSPASVTSQPPPNFAQSQYMDGKQYMPLYQSDYSLQPQLMTEPMTNISGFTGGYNSDIIEKLNKIIYLLEQQEEQQTGHVTEELILYCFLGVFIIFVIDSFTKAGKYIR